MNVKKFLGMATAAGWMAAAAVGGMTATAAGGGVSPAAVGGMTAIAVSGGVAPAAAGGVALAPAMAGGAAPAMAGGVAPEVAGGVDAAAEPMEGSWGGLLQLAPGLEMQLVLNISVKDSSITMDSPDQGAFGIKGETLFLSSDSVAFSVPTLMMTYTGTRKDETIEGTFRQSTLTLPLTLKHSEFSLNRPQTPTAPFPYTTEEVTIDNPAGNSRLAGTLTLPEGYSEATPVVVMVTGSGLQDRDEALFGHKPFAVIADYLARNGIASLRYDDRGFGKSTGDAFDATTLDFASDAEAVMKWLRSQGRFGKTGILGHSEGGMIAYILGARDGDRPDFIVSVAGPSVKGTRTIAFQNKMALLSIDMDEKLAADFGAAMERALEYKLGHPEAVVASDELLDEFYPNYAADPTSNELATSISSMLNTPSDNPWMVWFLAYDPASDLRNLKSPAMIIYGEKDMQVPPSLNLEPAREYAEGADIRVYEDLNHLMQHAEKGFLSEYSQIEETFSPEVLSDIASFILKQ